MIRFFFAFAALNGLVGVAMGAFAAHALQGRLDERLLNVVDTGVRYQFWHLLALLGVALLMLRFDSRWLLSAGWLFSAGILLFSGSLYALALTGQKWFGPITPLGGMLLMAGWLSLLGWGLFAYPAVSSHE